MIYNPILYSSSNLSPPSDEENNSKSILSYFAKSKILALVVDIINHEIVQHINLEECLGYDKRWFSLEKYYEYMHHSHREIISIYDKSAIKLIKNNHSVRNQLRGYSYELGLAILHRDKYYLWTNRYTHIVEYNSSGMPTKIMHVHILGGNFDSKHHFIQKVKLIDKNNTLSKDLVNIFHGKARRHLSIYYKTVIFTPREIEICELLLKLGKKNSIAEIAKRLNTSEENVRSHRKNIIAKGKQHIRSSFSKASDVAFYLKKMEVIFYYSI